jgi:hypothetical protein
MLMHVQAVLAHTHESIGSHTFKHGKASKSYSYKGVAALAALDIVTPAIPMPNDYGMAPPSPPSPPESCSTLLDVLPRMPRSGNSLGVPPAPHTNIHALLAGSFSTGHQQPLTSNSGEDVFSLSLSLSLTHTHTHTQTHTHTHTHTSTPAHRHTSLSQVSQVKATSVYDLKLLVHVAVSY